MGRRFVPVTLGSPEFKRAEVGAFRVTEARFPPQLMLPMHVHERACFAVILDGSWDEIFPGKTYHCEPNTVLVEPPGERHANRFERAGARVVVIEPDSAADELLRPVSRLLSSADCVEDVVVSALARRLARELDEPDPVTPLVIEGLVLEILALAARRRPVKPAGFHPPSWLLRAEELVRERSAEGLRLGEVAMTVGVHPVRLTRHFRRQFGMSLGAYVRRLRVDRAAHQLAATEEPLATIAAHWGFADQAHFTRVFKRATGFTPGQFRVAARS